MPMPIPAEESLPTLFELLESLPIGVILLDDSGRVRLYNAAEERFARRRREDVLDRVFFDEIAPCFENIGVAEVFRRCIGREPFSVERDASFALPFRKRCTDPMSTRRGRHETLHRRGAEMTVRFEAAAVR